MNVDFLNEKRYDYFQYVNSPLYAGFIEKEFGSLGWRRILLQWSISSQTRNERVVSRELASQGQLVLGSVVLANSGLHELEVAPALILGTFDTSAHGFIELIRVQNAIWAADESGDSGIIDAVDSIYADLDFDKYRRRPVPAALNAPPEMFFFDQKIRRDDMSTLRYTTEEGDIDFPIVSMLASLPDEHHAADVLPQPISRSIVGQHYYDNQLGSYGLHLIDQSHIIQPNTISGPWLTKTKIIIGVLILLFIIGAVSE